MPKPHFRAGVVAVVQRADGAVMAFERSDIVGQWQLPQGGIEQGESPRAAVWRELAEETGLDQRHVELVREHADWTVYVWPESMRVNHRLGQAHRWFFFRPREETVAPEPDGSEFRGWRWMSPEELVEQVVEFRKAPYRQVFDV